MVEYQNVGYRYRYDRTANCCKARCMAMPFTRIDITSEARRNICFTLVAVIARTWPAPAATARTWSSMATGANVFEVARVALRPSCPLTGFPQENKTPSAILMHHALTHCVRDTCAKYGINHFSLLDIIHPSSVPRRAFL